jgi:hypothetical protein
MPTTKTIVGYLYRGEYYCPACIVEAVDAASTQSQRGYPERWLDYLAAFGIVDRAREHSFSQHDFPHTITDDMLEPPRPVCDTCVTELR